MAQRINVTDIAKDVALGDGFPFHLGSNTRSMRARVSFFG
jgi:hypothetical protein